MSDPNDWNKQIIEEFRANDGKVGGHFENMTLLLLHTTGVKSGQPRLNPVAYVKDGDQYVIMASKGGAPTHPDWYYNLVANPQVTVEVGSENSRHWPKLRKARNAKCCLRRCRTYILTLPNTSEIQSASYR